MCQRGSISLRRFIGNSGWYERATIKEHMQEGNMTEVRSKFNSWVNKTAKFMK